jgi:hypothetical protein
MIIIVKLPFLVSSKESGSQKSGFGQWISRGATGTDIDPLDFHQLRWPVGGRERYDSNAVTGGMKVASSFTSQSSSSSSSSGVFRLARTSEPLVDCILHSTLFHSGGPYPAEDEGRRRRRLETRRRVGIPFAIGVTQLPPSLRVGLAEAGNLAQGREDVCKGLTVLRRPNYLKSRPRSDLPKLH